MLNEMEMENYIGSSLPEMPHCTHQLAHGSCTLENIIELSSFMEERFRERDLKEVKKICYVAEHLYNHGNGKAKTGIEKLFIGCLSAIMPQKKEERCRLQAIIPITIYSIYVQRFLHSTNHKKQ